MVTLINIKKLDNIVYAEYFPEDNVEDIGILVYDIKKEIVVEKEYCQADRESFLKTYFHKAIRTIEKCIEKDDFPEKMVYMWY